MSEKTKYRLQLNPTEAFPGGRVVDASPFAPKRAKITAPKRLAREHFFTHHTPQRGGTEASTLFSFSELSTGLCVSRHHNSRRFATLAAKEKILTFGRKKFYAVLNAERLKTPK